MNGQLDILRSELLGIWRYRWSVLVTMLIVATLGWSLLFFTPNVYEASSRVYVDATSALKPLLEGLAVNANVDSQLNFVRQTMLSRPALEKVAQKTELDLRARSAKAREKLIDELKKKIVIEAAVSADKTSADKLYTISYQDRNREMALSVVKITLNTFVENATGAGREGSVNAQRFLREQIQDVESRLAEDETKLADFKKNHPGLVPGQTGDYFQHLETEREALKRAQSSLAIAQVKREALQRQLKGEIPYVPQPGEKHPRGTTGVLSGNEIAGRLQDAEAHLEELRLKYTDKHPEILATEDTIAQLRAKQQAELEAIKHGDAAAAVSSGLTSNPVYQSIQLALNQADVEVAGLQGEVSDRQRTIGELEHAKAIAPEIEAQYTSLNRDYTAIHAQYEALQGRLEKAKLSEQATESGSIKFEVIDPPVAKLEPVKPNRLMLTLMIFAGAAVSGLGVGWVRNQTRSVYESKAKLASDTGLLVVATISPMSFPAKVVVPPRQRWQFLGLVVALLGGLALALLLAVLGLSSSHWTG